MSSKLQAPGRIGFPINVERIWINTVKRLGFGASNASQYGNNAYIAPQASMSDGLMDVIIMEPFDVLEAPQVSFDMFNKTLDKNSKIKTFKCKKLHITRSKAGQ